MNGNNVDAISPRDANLMKYHQLEEDEQWKVAIVKEMTNVKFGRLDVEDFSIEELDEMISTVCTS